MEQLSGFLLLALRLLVPGFLVAGLWPGLIRTGRVAVVVLAGWAVNLLIAVALTSVGWWTPLMDWVVWGLVVVGLAWPVVRDASILCPLMERTRFRVRGNTSAREAGPLQKNAKKVMFINEETPVVLGVMVFALMMPVRSEWLAGGWDPGLYVNNAVALASSTSLEPDGDSIYAAMTREERLLLSTAENSYREIFPGVPIDPETGALPRYFFHLTPLAGALLFRLGGFDLLFRMPVLLAFMGVPVFIWLAQLLGLKRWPLVVAGMFWCLSPVWWYQQAIPTSEMLYLLLVTGGVACYLEAFHADRRRPLVAGLLFFLATVNHFNVPLLAGVFVLVMAGVEVCAGKKHGAYSVAVVVAGVVVGVAWDAVHAWVTLSRLDEKDAVLALVLVPFFALALVALLVIRMKPAWLSSICWTRLFRIGMVLVGCGLAGMAVAAAFPALRNQVMDFWAPGHPLRGALYRASLVGSFLHPVAVGVAGCGCWVLGLRGDPAWRPVRLLVLVTGGLLMLLLLSPGIAAIYPWGLRRFVPVLLPMMALAQVGVLSGLHVMNRWGWLGMAGLLLAGVGAGAMNSRAAMRVGDYCGLRDALDVVHTALRPDDLVITDDYRFGTPLLLAYHQSVINGNVLRHADAPDRAAVRALVDRMQVKLGGRILWLTSSTNGVAVYPDHPVVMAKPVAMAWLETELVVHSPRGNHFRTKPWVFDLRLYEQAEREEP